MSLSDYIAKVISDFSKADGNEVPGIKNVSFDIGIHPHGNELRVDDNSQNRIKFTLLIGRK